MYQTCTPAEALQTSLGSNFAQSVTILKLGTWNVRSMVDTVGTIEMASQWANGQSMGRWPGRRGEESRSDCG